VYTRALANTRMLACARTRAHTHTHIHTHVQAYAQGPRTPLCGRTTRLASASTAATRSLMAWSRTTACRETSSHPPPRCLLRWHAYALVPPRCCPVPLMGCCLLAGLGDPCCCRCGSPVPDLRCVPCACVLSICKTNRRLPAVFHFYIYTTGL